MLYFFTAKAVECKSRTSIFHASLGEPPGLSFHPDVYIFSLPPSPFCLMNFQSVRCSISAPLLFFPSLVHAVYHLWPIPVLMLRVGLRVALEWVVGGSTLGLRVFKQAEIFMYVGLCRCVRAPSRVPLLALGMYVSLHGCGVKNTEPEKTSAYWYVYSSAPVCTCSALCQVMREAPSFDSAPKLRLCTSITHDLLYMGSHSQEEEELTEHASVILHNRVQGTYLTHCLLYAAAEPHLWPDYSPLNVFGSDYFFTENMHYPSNLELISSVHNHINSEVLLSVVWRTVLPPPVTHMAFQRAINREFTLVPRIFNPSLRSSRFTDQLIPCAFFPHLSQLPSLYNHHKHTPGQRKPDWHTPPPPIS